MKVSFKQFSKKETIDDYINSIKTLNIASEEETNLLGSLLTANIPGLPDNKENKIKASSLLTTIITKTMVAKFNYIDKLENAASLRIHTLTIQEKVNSLNQQKQELQATLERISKLKSIIQNIIPDLLFLLLTAAAFLLYISFILVMPVGGLQVLTSIAFITSACLFIPFLAVATYNLIERQGTSFMGEYVTRINHIDTQIEIEQNTLLNAQPEDSMDLKMVELYDHVIFNAKAQVKEFAYDLECYRDKEQEINDTTRPPTHCQSAFFPLADDDRAITNLEPNAQPAALTV